MMQQIKIKCVTPECLGKEFALMTVEKGKMTVVNESGNIIRDTTKYIYKCLTCQAMVTTDIAPHTFNSGKLLHG